ncbi:MAG TPA: hypothetical protein VK176_01145 [Phycisphaerales bacterium]|nr:hypothetical protein [Phycisphaerales bacterium]
MSAMNVMKWLAGDRSTFPVREIDGKAQIRVPQEVLDHAAWLIEWYGRMTYPLDALPYTPGFNKMCDEFSETYSSEVRAIREHFRRDRRLRELPSTRYAIWRYVLRLRKDRLFSTNFKRPSPGLRALFAFEERFITKRTPVTRGAADRLPYTRRFDRLYARYEHRRLLEIHRTATELLRLSMNECYRHLVKKSKNLSRERDKQSDFAVAEPKAGASPQQSSAGIAPGLFADDAGQPIRQ